MTSGRTNPRIEHESKVIQYFYDRIHEARVAQDEARMRQDEERARQEKAHEIFLVTTLMDLSEKCGFKLSVMNAMRRERSGGTQL